MSEQQRNTMRTVRRLLLVTALMFAFGFVVMPPMYNAFCAITGLGGKTGRETEAQAAAKGVDKGRWVTVEFVTSTSAGLPWDFAPLTRKVRVHPGEVTEVDFAVESHADQSTTGQAVPSLAPNTAARYFKKTECFCFQRQQLAAREHRVMPVRFVVDPDLPKDETTLTLSYTFFRVQDSTVARDAGPTAKQGS